MKYTCYIPYNKKVIAYRLKERTILANEQATEVKMKLITTIRPVEGESETYEMWLQGSFLEKTGSYYIRYEEIQNDQTIRTTMKFSQNQALILRGGAINMRLPLNTEEPQIGHYESEYGSLPLMTHTQAIEFSRKSPHENSGQLQVQYDLILSGQKVGNYKVNIQFTEVLS